MIILMIRSRTVFRKERTWFWVWCVPWERSRSVVLRILAKLRNIEYLFQNDGPKNTSDIVVSCPSPHYWMVGMVFVGGFKLFESLMFSHEIYSVALFINYNWEFCVALFNSLMLCCLLLITHHCIWFVYKSEPVSFLLLDIYKWIRNLNLFHSCCLLVITRRRDERERERERE